MDCASMRWRRCSTWITARREGEWVPNRYGGRENLEAIDFLKQFNRTIYEIFPDVQTIAEESTAWPLVSRPVYLGGLGFGLKWDMGWMHDTLEYFSQDPIYRKYHHDQLTFRLLYAFHENFILPLSHDEVVYGKRSLLNKMPGDDWQTFRQSASAVRLHVCPAGKKLLFMGGEIAPVARMDARSRPRMAFARLTAARGHAEMGGGFESILSRQPALHELDFDPGGIRMDRL